MFMCGDYEFETRSYGISGASGRFSLKIEKKLVIITYVV